MNKSFVEASKHYLSVQPEITHAQVVMRLYRDSLKLARSWCVDRGVFNEEATRIQGQFRENKTANPGKATRLINQARHTLISYAHPDPVILPYMPGGTSFMRNPPLPLSVCYPDGLPAGVEDIPEVNIDMTQGVPGEKSFGGRVLVDSANKVTL